MRSPLFWYKKPGVRSTLLTPLSWLWEWAGKRRVAKTHTTRADVPVICVGNINLGGTGKTPTVIALVQLLGEMGHTPFILSRGYGGSENGPHRVKRTDFADQVGDEPLMMQDFAPVIISKDRAKGAELAVDQGASCIVLDDGMQNTQLHKDFTFWVVDGFMQFGNEKICPAGPLRESILSGREKSDLMVVIGASGEEITQKYPTLADMPFVDARIDVLQTGMDWTVGSYFAFAGIGEPRKFFRSLEKAGAHVVGEVGFGDHESYTAAALSRLEKQAAQKGAQLVTTEKDAMRLPSEFRSKILAFPVRLNFENQKIVQEKLAPVLGRQSDQ